MAENSKIEWTDATWNPITGCSVVSPGCTNCYAMRLAGTRMKNHWSRKGLTSDSKAGPVWNGEVRFNDPWLTQPLAWGRPRMIFVCAHADLFHESVPDEWIDRVFAMMALAPQHTYQILTKRSERMHKWAVDRFTNGCRGAIEHRARQIARDANIHIPAGKTMASPEPFPHIWMGVSAEDQARADDRVPTLLDTPAAVRWVSAEPMLGPLDLTNLRRYNANGKPWIDALRGLVTRGDYLARSPTECSFNTRTQCAPPEMPPIDWVVAGGESGPAARAVHPGWLRSLRDQCKAAGVAFNFKQWGEFAPDDPAATHTAVRRVGKKAAGRLLDGITHDEFP